MSKSIVSETEFTDEMKDAFRQFGTYANHGRALPNVLDGLKPVHRRIIWGMYSMKATPDRTRVKSARAVGDITGKYHPHGGAACYSTMVTLAQPFSKRVPLVDGHGNWGSLSFGPAAERYTECRLQREAVALLGSAPGIIDGPPEVAENGVDFISNYSGEFEEPVVLPALFPNFVINGYEGIGVGIAGKAPQHNLTEVMNLAIKMVDTPNPRMSTVLELLPGPDMPCDADIFDVDGGIESYIKTGYGTFAMRGRWEIEEYKITARRTGHKIFITSLPYQVSPEAIVEGVMKLKDNAQLPQDISVANIGSKQIRIAIDVNENDPEDVIQRILYHSRTTRLQETFSCNMNAVHDGEIKAFGVLDALRVWIEHRRRVVRRRSAFRLEKAESRLHIVLGFIKAVPLADKIVILARESANRAEAEAEMCKRWDFTPRQANSIMDMSLARITKLGVEEYEAEKLKLEAIIHECQDLLNNPASLDTRLKKEMRAIRDAYGTGRRCTLRSNESHVIQRPTTPAVEIPATSGYIAVTANRWVRWTTRSNITKIVGTDHVVDMLRVTDQNMLDVVTNWGWHYRTGIDSVPERMAKAEALFEKIETGEKIVMVQSGATFEGEPSIVMVTAHGMGKRISFDTWANHRTNKAYQITPLDDGDSVEFSFMIEDGSDIGVLTAEGRLLRMDLDSLLPKGRGARALPLIRLSEDDRIVWAGPLNPGEDLVYWTSAEGVGWFNVDDVEYGNRGTRGHYITRSKNLIVGATNQQGNLLAWFDGSTEEPSTLELKNQSSGITLTDRQLKLVAPGIKKANAVWMDIIAEGN